MSKSLITWIAAGAVVGSVLLGVTFAVAFSFGHDAATRAERRKAVDAGTGRYETELVGDTPIPKFVSVAPVKLPPAAPPSPLDEARKEITALSELMSAQDKVRQQVKAEVVPLPPVTAATAVEVVPIPQPVKADHIRPQVIAPDKNERPVLTAKKQDPPVLDALLEPGK